MNKPASLTVILLLLRFIADPQPGRGQARIDSLQRVVAAGAEDTNTVKAYNLLSLEYKNQSRFREAVDAGSRAIELAGRLKYARGLGRAYKFTGVANIHLGNYPDALKNYFECLKCYTGLDDKYNMAGCHVTIGIIYWYMKDNTSARKHYWQAISLYEELGNRKGVADCYGNIGNLYLDEARAAKSANDLNSASEKLQHALANFSNVLGIYQELAVAQPAYVPHKQSIAGTYNNLGNVLAEQARIHAMRGDARAARLKVDSVIANMRMGLQLFEALGDKQGMSGSLNNMADTYREFNQPEKAIGYSLQGLALGRETGSKDDIKTSYYTLYASNEALGRYGEALAYYKLYMTYADSLLNEENTKKTVQAEMQFEFDKKEAAVRLEQEKKEAVAQAEGRRQRIILLSISGLGLLVLGFAVFAYRSFLQKRRANVEITAQKHLIEEKQKEILDSIHYARRIQRSLITQESYIQKNLKRLQNGV